MSEDRQRGADRVDAVNDRGGAAAAVDASTRRHTHGVAKALTPIRLQNALCAAAPPPPSRTYAIMKVM